MKLQGESLIESIICTAGSIAENMAVEGVEHIDRALAENRGAILLGSHFDMWEMAGYFLAGRYDNVATVFKAMKNTYVNRYLLKTRERSRLAQISSKNALRPVLSRLKKGGAVVIMFDQNAGREGLPATFFGRRAMTYSAPAAFALKTGCAVIPLYMVKEEGFRRHRLIILPPVPLIRTGDEEGDIMANTQQYNDLFEDLVRRHPALWFCWLHRRWRLPGSRRARRGGHEPGSGQQRAAAESA